MMAMNNGVLYISYDGMLEPLGQSQVLAYLEAFAAERPLHLLSFEKAEDWRNASERRRMAERIAAAGIHWHPLRYHKRPSALATAWDIAVGAGLGLWLTFRFRLRIIHARSYVAALMALVIKRTLGVWFLFDMRGFWADERVDGGLWPQGGRLYRMAKACERRFLQEADHVVSLTEAAVAHLRGLAYLNERMPPVTVIPTCADLSRFQPLPRIQAADGFVLGYVGSAGTWYLFEQTLACFKSLRQMRPDARLLIANRGEHEFIRQQMATADIPSEAVELVAVAHEAIPQLMARMDAGIFLIKPLFSKQASAPTKLAEFLGCGIPCLGNAGVGDMAGILESEGVGIALQSFDEDAVRQALARLLTLAADPATRERCVAAARKHFTLEVGVERYRLIYQQLAG